MVVTEKVLQQEKENVPAILNPLIFDLFCAIKEIKELDSFNSIYMNVNEKLEIYVFYEQENFDTEDKIVKAFTDWEEEHKYFPEIFIYPLDMIEDKNTVLPENAVVV